MGIITPLVSFALSGMPLDSVLPRILIEGMCFGLIAGIMRERYNLNTLASVAVAVITGRAVALAVLLLIYGFNTSTVSGIWDAVTLGWPGIVLQLILLPLIMYIIEYTISIRSKRNGFI